MEVTAPPAPCVRAPSTAAAAMRPPLGPRMGGCANSASSLDTKPSGNLYCSLFFLRLRYITKSQRTLSRDLPRFFFFPTPSCQGAMIL